MKIGLKIICLLFLFGLLPVSCTVENDDGTTNGTHKGNPIKGPLFDMQFIGVKELTANEKGRLDSAAEDDGVGFFGEEMSESALRILGNFAVKIDEKWYKRPTVGAKLGPTGVYYWYFGNTNNLGKMMEKWERTFVTAGYGFMRESATLREEKPFAYVDNEEKDEIQIDDQVYKYILEDSKTKEIVYTDDNGNKQKYYMYFRTLKIFYDGIDEAPTLYMRQY